MLQPPKKKKKVESSPKKSESSKKTKDKEKKEAKDKSKPKAKKADDKVKASKKKEPVPVKITPLKKGSPKKKTPKKGIWLYMTVTNVYVNAPSYNLATEIATRRCQFGIYAKNYGILIISYSLWSFLHVSEIIICINYYFKLLVLFNIICLFHPCY